jgi:uncharacterized membrane protein
MRIIARISLLIYPLVAHIGIMMHQVKWPACYLIVVVYLNSLKLLSQHKIVGIGFTALVCGVLYLIVFSGESLSIMYLPPVLIPGWLAFVFIGSLRTKQAVISGIAERIEGKPLDLKHLQYTRQLTALWGIVFVLMVCEAIVLAAWASHEVWSWWVNIGNYIIVAVLFFGEMMLRQKIIGRQVHIGHTFKDLLLRSWHS